MDDELRTSINNEEEEVNAIDYERLNEIADSYEESPVESDVEPSPEPQPETPSPEPEKRGIFPLIKRDLPEEDPDKKYTPKGGAFYPGANEPLKNLQNTMSFLAAPGFGVLDLPVNAVTGIAEWLGIPGAQALDNAWDRATRLPNDGHQKLRRFSEVVIPSFFGGGAVVSGVSQLNKLNKVQKALVTAGLFSVVDAGVIGFADAGEDENLSRMLADMLPGVFGANGAIPIQDSWKTLDSDHPTVRRQKNMYESAGLSIISTMLGAAIQARSGLKKMGWFIPDSDSAAAYKRNEIVKAGDPEKLIRMQEINEVLATGKLSKQNERLLMDELMRLEDSLETVDSLDDALRQVEESRINERDIAANRKVDNGLGVDDFDPDVTPITSESSNARQSIPPGNVAKNMADTTAIKNGIVDPTNSDPAPIITEAMRSKGLMVGATSRDAIMGVAAEAADIGRFNALTDGFRFSAQQMNAAAWDIYTSIIDPGASLDDIKALFETDKDITNLLMGRFRIEHFNEEQARAAAFAMRDLSDRFLGRSVTESSARAMDTLGREASTIAKAMTELSPVIDENRAMDLIIDKMQFLMDEYGLNKYISGWKLRNKNWFDQVPPKELDSVLEQLTAEFTAAENAIHAKNIRFTKTLKELYETNPAAIRPLVDAFAHTNGDVDTLAKLMNWASSQVSPMGLLKSPDPTQLNLFARGAWGVRYNNVLSGISSLRAMVGNSAQVMLRPITGLLGHGVWGLQDGFEGLKRSFYYHGAVYETNRRAIQDAWTMMKRAHKDPELMMKSYRKDFIFKEDKAWDILEDMREVWELEGNYGRIIQYDMAKNMRDLAKHPALRYGMTGMVFPDVFTNTHIAHYLSRLRAYEDVFTEFGFADWKRIAKAEKAHYKNMFNADGTVKDSVVKSFAGEISLNLDDGLATWLNKATTAYPIAKDIFMFPRTQSNSVRMSLSWTPISLIPGINKYSKTIWARTDEEIAEALLEHGIIMDTTPNAKAIWQSLRAEYTGRVAFSSLLTKSLWDYAMGGNIRGNGHYNGRRRRQERDQFGYEPKTINLGGKWVSYKGIIGVDQVLSIIGDMSYYARDIDQHFLEDWQSKLMWTISAAFLNETPLQGLEPLVAAATGDSYSWNRLAANSLRSWIPLSGAMGVLSDAIDSAQKDIAGEMQGYLMNRLPGLKSMLSDQIDIWTGEPLNDIDNPFLRILNSVSPIKVNGTREPWRVWLESTGWDGFSRLKTSSDGSYEYTTKEREAIYRLIGEQQLYKQLIPLMNSKRYNEELNMLRNHRRTSSDLRNEDLKLKTQNLPVIQEIDAIIKTAQVLAEERYKLDNKIISVMNEDQQLINELMKNGDVEGAAEVQQHNLESQKLLQMAK